MRTFIIDCKIAVTAYTVVRATTEEEALRIAEKRQGTPIPNLASSSETSEWIVEEIDGLPTDIQIHSELF